MPDGSFQFSRDYSNGSGHATGIGTSEGDLFYWSDRRNLTRLCFRSKPPMKD